jgi:hypothetical protein
MLDYHYSSGKCLGVSPSYVCSLQIPSFFDYPLANFSSSSQLDRVSGIGDLCPGEEVSLKLDYPYRPPVLFVGGASNIQQKVCFVKLTHPVYLIRGVPFW